MHIKFKRCIKRAEGTNATFVEITQDNVDQIRTLWKQPKAEVGQIYVRFGVAGSRLVNAEHFERYYREPKR